MKRTVGVKWGNLRTGLLLLFAVAVAMWASLSGGGVSIFESKRQFTAYFKNVNGLVSGSPVWMSGVEVGNVKSVKFVNLDTLRRVEVVCRVKKSAWPMMTEGVEVLLGTIGLLGDKYLEIIPGPLDGVPIEPYSEVRVRDAGDALAMFKAGEEAIDEAKSMVDNLNILLARMNRGEGTLGQLVVNEMLYHDLTQLASHLTELVSGLQKDQERIVASLEKTAKSVEHLSTQVSSNTGTIGRLVNDPRLYDNLTATSARLDTIMHKLNNAEGTAGLLVSDTALYVEMVNLITRVNNLVTDIEKNPRKYFKFSIF
ncbi:MAG: MlaD family protein [Candidatus Zixiibacteriota bacterium]